MDCVLTLIADPKTRRLRDGHAEKVRKALRAMKAETARGDWLATGVACDIHFKGPLPHEAVAAARVALDGEPIDVIGQATEDRRKQLLVADMDSTIVTAETLDELAAFAGADVQAQIERITARAMNGELDFREALIERVAMLAGMGEDRLEEAWKSVELMPGAVELVRTMRADGAVCVLVSGGFSFFTERVKRICGFNFAHSNRFDMDGGTLTGRVIEPILDRDAKLNTLLMYSAEKEISLEMAAAVGDGANDIPMLKAAGLGVAYHAKPVAAAEASHRVDHADLTALLFAQGYRDEDIVTA